MLLTRAVEADYASIVDLANRAYRGTGSAAGWTTETDFLEGQRLSEDLLREDFRVKPEAQLLMYREDPRGPILGTVWLEPKTDCTWYMGLLTIRPDRQNQQLGRLLLSDAETFAIERGARRMGISVLNVRDTLIAWYQRRGYTLTGETQPFPYVDLRFGKPLRDDLHFVLLEKPLV